jgi:hypothetical protein
MSSPNPNQDYNFTTNNQPNYSDQSQTTVNEDVTSTQPPRKVSCSEIPLLFWYIAVSFILYTIIHIIFLCAYGESYDLYNLSFQGTLYFSLVWFIYLIIRDHEDKYCSWKNTVAIFFLVFCVGDFVIIFYLILLVIKQFCYGFFLFWQRI